MKWFKRLCCLHEWQEKVWIRSCHKCNLVQEVGFIGDAEDWHRPADTTVKRMLIGFVIKLKVGK